MNNLSFEKYTKNMNEYILEGLDNSKLTGKFFLKYMKGYTDQSLYQIIRWGTYPKAGRKQYMPQYSKEKMSDDQIEDLIAYMKKLSEK